MPKIEMAMAVLVKEGSPMVMHMSIARNPFNRIEESNQHQRISLKFHAFAAKVILTAYISTTGNPRGLWEASKAKIGMKQDGKDDLWL